MEQYRMHLEDKVRKETEKRIRQEELLSRQIRMNQMAELISNLAHHWRQPLNTIGLAIQSLPGLYEEGGLSKDFLEKFSSENTEAIVRLSSMIDYFYDLSDRNRSSDSSFSPSDAVTDTVRMLEPVSGGNRFRSASKVSRSCFIKGDKHDFTQCLYSVFSNALDAFTEKSITDGEIQISLQISGAGWLQIEISNNAGEIPESILGRLFDPYFTTKKMHSHRGPGLYQAKPLLKKTCTEQ